MKPTFQLTSSETGTEYWLFVQAPDPATAPGPWPTVLFLDGDNMFASGVAAYRKVHAAGAVPPLLLVGVGYGASFGQAANRRGRDYTPTHHADEPTSGGAEAFLAFLTGSLWPELGRRYPLHQSRRAIAGHSLGSLLVLDALFRTSPFFSGHLASAPSIWWDDRAILEQARALRARRRSLEADLYLAVGGRDSKSMIGDLKLLEAQLAERPFDGLRVTSERFPKRTHYNALAETFPAGLTALFGTKR